MSRLFLLLLLAALVLVVQPAASVPTTDVTVIVDGITLPAGSGQLVSGSSWVKPRAFESAGYTVVWDASSKTVRINRSASPPIPTPTPVPTVTPSPIPSVTPTPPACGASLQSLVNAAPSGSVLLVPACLYRETVIITKALTLDAQPGAEIRGSDVVGGWTLSGSVWTKTGLPILSLDTGVCQAGTTRCKWREQVFLDGIPLVQVAANPLTGQFSVDRTTGIYTIADNPTGHTVEVTVRDRWVLVQANNITIKGFVMRNASAATAQGGINGAVSDLTLDGNALSDVHGQIINIGGTPTFLSPRIRILNNILFNGGDTAIGLGGAVNGTFDGSLIQANILRDNNTELFDYNWHAGGMKINRAKNVTINNNLVHHNDGPGIWLDSNSLDIVVSNNRIHHNGRAGVFFEVSQGASIFGNRIWNNGRTHTGSHTANSGIFISSASNADVHDNILAWNGAGINVQSDDRTIFNPVNGFGNNVHANVIVQVDSSVLFAYGLGWLDFWNGTLSNTASNNQGSANRYGYCRVIGTPPICTDAPETTFARYRWGSPGVSYTSLSAFNATPGEEGGTYLTLVEQTAILTAASMPISP